MLIDLLILICDSFVCSDSDSIDPRDLSIDINDFLQKRNDVRDQKCLLKILEAQVLIYSL